MNLLQIDDQLKPSYNQSITNVTQIYNKIAPPPYFVGYARRVWNKAPENLKSAQTLSREIQKFCLTLPIQNDRKLITNNVL